VHFDYHTGGFNLNEASEQGQVVPQQEGNYVWVTPQGGPNIYAGQSQDTGDMATNGIYMYQEQQSTPLSPASRFDDLAAARLPITENADAPVYACTLTPTKPPYYKANFEIGDAIGLNIDKSTWKVGTTSALGRPLKQRIYQVNLDMSDLNMETATPLISSDYASRVVPAGG
jgi:hypothetical protein